VQCTRMYTTLVVDIIKYTDYGRHYVMRPPLFHSGAIVKFESFIYVREFAEDKICVCYVLININAPVYIYNCAGQVCFPPLTCQSFLTIQRI
jgi:hypothetical protein